MIKSNVYFSKFTTPDQLPRKIGLPFFLAAPTFNPPLGGNGLVIPGGKAKFPASLENMR